MFKTSQNYKDDWLNFYETTVFPVLDDKKNSPSMFHLLPRVLKRLAVPIESEFSYKTLLKRNWPRLINL